MPTYLCYRFPQKVNSSVWCYVWWGGANTSHKLTANIQYLLCVRIHFYAFYASLSIKQITQICIYGTEFH